MHYLQDAASPPHVVPVTHGLTDGFENYSISDPQLLAASQGEKDCEKLLHSGVDFVSNQESVSGLLPESGVGTLRLLSEFAIHAKSDGDGEKILGAADFWRESPLDTARGVRPFGDYGNLGNSYGELEQVIDGTSYHVPKEEYDRVKVAYLRLGVEISKKLLSYGWAAQKK